MTSIEPLTGSQENVKKPSEEWDDWTIAEVESTEGRDSGETADVPPEHPVITNTAKMKRTSGPFKILN